MNKYFIKMIVGVTACYAIAGCTNNPPGPAKKEADTVKTVVDTTNYNAPVVRTSDATILSADPKLVKRYEAELNKDTVAQNKVFIETLLGLIQKFNGKSIDTTVLVTGNIDGTGSENTLYNRIYLRQKSIIVQSWWMQDRDTLWRYKFKNPYVWISTSPLFQYDTRNTWVTFATAVTYAMPTLTDRKEYESTFNAPMEKMVDFGVSELKSKGYTVKPETYKKYLQKFEGALLNFGNPDNREAFKIWYRPAKCFITYYE